VPFFLIFPYGLLAVLTHCTDFDKLHPYLFLGWLFYITLRRPRTGGFLAGHFYAATAGAFSAS